MKKKNMKEMLRSSTKTIAFSFLIFAIILLFDLHYKGVLLIIGCLTIVMKAKSLYLYYDELRIYIDLFKSLFLSFILVSIVYGLAYLLGGYGLLGTIIIVLVLSGWRIISSRNKFMEGLRDIETSVWGNSLEKKNWIDKKPPKIKIVVGGKHKGGSMKNKKLTWVSCWISILLHSLVFLIAFIDTFVSLSTHAADGASILFIIVYSFGAGLAMFFLFVVPIIVMYLYMKKLVCAKNEKKKSKK